MIFAKDRAELVAATNALDRVLQWNELVVPQWFSPNVRIAYWDRYGQPKVLPGLTPGFLAGLVVRPGARRQVARRLRSSMMARRASIVRARSPAPPRSSSSPSPPRRPPQAKQSTGSRPSAISPTLPISQHFAYANPDAPKGGTFSLVGWGGVTTFNSLNNYILKGDAAQGLELLFDSLMTPAADEPDAVYGLVAESAEVADDRMSVTFHLRPEAKFADGTRAHRRRRGVLLRCAEDQGPPALSPDARRTW